jgi:hypothetical protein
MATCPLTTTELDDVCATLNRLCPDAPQWRTAPTPAGERGIILCGPVGIRVLIEIAWNAPERLLISGLFPASPAGDFYPPCAQITPAITVARTRGPGALATAILRRLLPTYQPRLQEAQARERAHRDAVARQEVVTYLLAQTPGCTARQTPGQVSITGTSAEVSAVWGQATVTLEGDITLTLHGLLPQTACALLTALHLTPRDKHTEGASHAAD